MSESQSSSRTDSRKRRRRRRRNKPDEGGNDSGGSSNSPRRRGGGDAPSGPNVVVPASSKNNRRRRSRRRRGAPVAGLTRRRRISRAEAQELTGYLSRMTPPLLSALYKGLGGQPTRVNEPGRVVQLTVRAIAQGKRLGNLLKNAHPRERTALATLIQCGGLAHSDEFLRELSISLGGQEREWRKVMLQIANKGLVSASQEQDGQFFYLVPDPLVEHMVEHLAEELKVPNFKHDDIELKEGRPFSPPLDFSITTLCAYLDQRPPRLTQQQEIFKVHKEEMDTFFAQLWSGDSELFHFHIDFLMLHGLVELRGDRLAVNRAVVEEWLALDPQDQRDLIFRALDKRFSYAEWILWAVHAGAGEWVPERPLSALYRRWKRGEDWRTRFHKGEYTATRSMERESYSFSPLVHSGMIELGEWGQEKFYRLTPRALTLLEPPEDDGFSQFYLTPSFEIMAPAGLAPLLLFRVGELSELTGADRANTYKITEISIERALEKGWRREDVLDFLRENSQTGLPENVEQTLKSWMGHHGDIEFHDCVVLTVHKSRIRKLESMRELKPYLLHRFVPGMYAVDRDRMSKLIPLLEELGFQPGKEAHHYPGDPEQSSARERLHEMVAVAREASDDPMARAHAADTQPEDLHPVPGSQVRSSGRKKRKDQPPRVSPRDARDLVDKAVATRKNLEVVYLTKDGKRVSSKVEPERLAISPAGDAVMVARDLSKDSRLTYKLTQIERMRMLERD